MHRQTTVRCALVLISLGLGGCASLVNNVADSLTDAVLNQPDPEIVRDGAPAYLIMADAFIEASPDSASALTTGAGLYTAYAAIFVDDPERRRAIATRAWDYGQRAMCARQRDFCGAHDLPFDGFQDLVDTLGEREVKSATAYATSWLAWIQAHSDDWVVVADLPRPEAVLERLLVLDEDAASGALHLYMGQLKCLRPAALGGEPEVGRAHFERAIELSEGRNLMAKVQFATSYARLLYDRELHDRLLEEVLAAEVEADGYTLTNVQAQRRARELLASADDYF